MLQLVNNSNYQAQLAVFPNISGVESLHVYIKTSFPIIEVADNRPTQLALCMGDTHWGDPITSSVKYPNDIYLPKVATDVFFIGQAWAEEGKLTSALDVRLQVADINQKIRVTGKRNWEKIGKSYQQSQAEPFQRMPLVYEYAYGGTDDDEGIAENPVGIGFKKSSVVEDHPMPLLEDPEHLLDHPDTRVPPAAFAAVAPQWMPRRQYLGTFDQQWQRHQAPYLPDDFNPKFFNSASQGLTSSSYIKAGERVYLNNLSRYHTELEFSLPTRYPQIEVLCAESSCHLDAKLQSLLIEPEENRYSLVWMDSYECDKKVLKVKEVRVSS